MILILDNGHGANTAGKASPDKRLREYAWARDMVKRIATKARALNIITEILVPEEQDIDLPTRAKRVNEICKRCGAANCILISIHNNAAGADGNWHEASGWSGWVSPQSSQRSRRLATLLYDHAETAGLKGNRSVPPQKYWVAGFYILQKTQCPAVLTENLFQDNRQDVEYLLSEQGKEAIADLHINAIKEYIKYYE